VALSVDTRRIARAWVVPWEIDDGLYGVAYGLGEGQHGSHLIGTNSEAERIVGDIAKQCVVAFRAAVRHNG
jgi:hypothetical protein